MSKEKLVVKYYTAGPANRDDPMSLLILETMGFTKVNHHYTVGNKAQEIVAIKKSREQANTWQEISGIEMAVYEGTGR